MAHRPFAPEKPGGHRPARFASRIKEELSLMLPSELSDPRLKDLTSLIITEVKVTEDLKNATVRFSLVGDERRARTVTACLNDAAGFLRNELSAKLESRVTPLLAFKYDRGHSNVGDIETLLKQAREKDLSTGTSGSADLRDSEDE